MIRPLHSPLFANSVAMRPDPQEEQARQQRIKMQQDSATERRKFALLIDAAMRGRYGEAAQQTLRDQGGADLRRFLDRPSSQELMVDLLLAINFRRRWDTHRGTQDVLGRAVRDWSAEHSLAVMAYLNEPDLREKFNAAKNTDGKGMLDAWLNLPISEGTRYALLNQQVESFANLDEAKKLQMQRLMDEEAAKAREAERQRAAAAAEARAAELRREAEELEEILAEQERAEAGGGEW